MRFNSSINNVKSKEWGLTLQQAYLFSWFYELPSWAESLIINEDVFYFASKNKAIDELPLLTTKPDTMYRYYKQLEELKLIVIKKIDSRDYIAITEIGKTWNKSDENPSKIVSVGNKSENTSEINPTYNNTIYNIKHLYKYKMSDISVLDDYSKLYLNTKKEEIEIDCTRAEGYAFYIAEQFRCLFIKNVEEKGGIPNDQIKAKFWAYVNPILLIIKKGGYNSDHLREIYQFLDSDAGEFWKPNILSTATLRKQMQKLILAKNSKQNKHKIPERN